MCSPQRYISICLIFAVSISFQVALCNNSTSANGDNVGFGFLTDYKNEEKDKLIICSSATNYQRRSPKSLEDLKAEVSSKLDLDNPYIADTAISIAADYPGEYNINQVCAIYNAMARGGWYYYSEANDRDRFQNANLTLQRGKMSNTIGRGDCDDFAILMASLIESLGGSTRITFAYDTQNKSGHAYSELYLGVKDDPQVNEIIKWIKSEYNLSVIPEQNDTGGEVWLNLDWGTNHPGGPYFGNNSTMVKRAVVRECPYKISPRIIPIIDSMDAVKGWKIIKDDYGSSINISSEPGIKDMAINISYNLTRGGWVGISKELDSNLLPRANGLNFSCFGLSNQDTIELRMVSENGTIFNISWARLKANEIWSYHRALYNNLKCSDLKEQCNFDPNKIKKIEFIISNQAGAEDAPGQGSLMLDNVHAIMAVPTGSPWEREEEKRKEALALQLASQAEMDLVKSTDPSLGVLLAIESLRTHETAEGSQALLHGMKLLPRPVFGIANSGMVLLAAAFSPNGSLLATASWDNASRIWNASTGRLVWSLEHNGPVNAVAFSHDGSLLATASDDNTSKIWNTSTGSEIWSLEHNGPVNAVIFSPDGSRLATASIDNTSRIWDTSTGRLVWSLEHNGPVNAVVFSPDGSRLATASRDNTARIWNASTGRAIKIINHSSPVDAIAFSTDGNLLATACLDKKARIWNSSTGIKPVEMEHESVVNAIAFSPDGRQLATASLDGTARLWDATTGMEIKRLEHQDGVEAVAFSPDGKQLATVSSDETTRLWDASTGSELARIKQGFVVHAIVAFSPDGKRLATFGWHGEVLIWDISTGAELARMNHKGNVNDIAFSPDGLTIATAGQGATLWKNATSEMIKEMPWIGTVWAVDFSPDGELLATASYDKIQIWDTSTGDELAGLKHEALVKAVAFSPDGNRFATASSDDTARLWNSSTGEQIILKHNLGVNAVAFSPDSKLLATACWDGVARIWNSSTCTVIAEMKHNGGVDNDNGVNDVAFSPDGKRLATASRDHTARVWDVSTHAELVRMNHKGYVNAIFFSHDGKQLATASQDHTARIWNVSTGTELARIEHEGYVKAVAFSPDGRFLATASSDNIARIWLLRPEDLITEACSRLIRSLTPEEWRQYMGDEPYRETCPCRDCALSEGR